ncbi:MAG: M23 family metallopeptidase [bacterium]|nr:M23 family metallopeptidase [bacterium]
MRNYFYWLLGAAVVILVSVVVYQPLPTNSDQSSPASAKKTKSGATVSPATAGLGEPVADWRSRITKKPFGIHITPATSPVQPERFSGYHTGADVEYDDVTADVPVHAIADGKIVFVGIINGYGGVIREEFTWQGATYTALYGHLRPTSLIKLGPVKQGEPIGVLGQGYSAETDGERRHLHLAILKGRSSNVRGYVSSQAALSPWVDPIGLYTHLLYN